MIQLVKRSISGDADAFLELMEKNSLAMYKVARGILDNDEDAADAMQDTILTCFEKIHTLKNPEYFKTWMIRILINECNKIHRHYKNFSRAEELPEVPGQDMSIEEFEFKEMLGMLDESYRIILVLYYVEGFRIADIASILNMNENTVKTRLVRARVQLKQEYTSAEDNIQKKRLQQKKKKNRTQSWTRRWISTARCAPPLRRCWTPWRRCRSWSATWPLRRKTLPCWPSTTSCRTSWMQPTATTWM